jgi:hypothetical protein
MTATITAVRKVFAPDRMPTLDVVSSVRSQAQGAYQDALVALPAEVYSYNVKVTVTIEDIVITR